MLNNVKCRSIQASRISEVKPVFAAVNTGEHSPVRPSLGAAPRGTTSCSSRVEAPRRRPRRHAANPQSDLWPLFHRETILTYMGGRVYARCTACTSVLSLTGGIALRGQLKGDEEAFSCPSRAYDFNWRHSRVNLYSTHGVVHT
jgi:hypothetical protein